MADDYLSRLPESLIHHILSFLPSNQICVLSKYFNSVWNNCPHLAFYLEASRFKKNTEGVDSFEQCLFGRPFIQQLRIEILGCYYINNLKPKLDRWLGRSVEKNVSTLVLNVYYLVPVPQYSVPQQVLVSRTLEILDLSNCTLDEHRIVHIDLPRLEKLSLYNCRFVGDNLLQKILCASPKIKHISLEQCSGLGYSLSVSSTPLLKHFSLSCEVDDFDRIKIDVPSLHTFTYRSSDAACAIDLTSCTNLKELYLYFVVDWVLEKLQSVLFRIQVLELNFCRLEKKHKISSQSLKRLILHGSDRTNDIEIDAPNLQSFECSLLRLKSSMLMFNSWSIPKANDIHMKFLRGGFQVACRAGIQDFLMKLPNYEDLKLLIFNKPTLGSNYLIMIKELHAVSFSSLQTLAENSNIKGIFISSRDETNLVHHMFSENRYLRYGSTIPIICSSWQNFKSFRKKFENWSFLKVKYGPWLQKALDVNQH